LSPSVCLLLSWCEFSELWEEKFFTANYFALASSAYFLATLSKASMITARMRFKRKNDPKRTRRQKNIAAIGVNVESIN
jgi:hypothetical protein